jgi:hypothetical protein
LKILTNLLNHFANLSCGKKPLKFHKMENLVNLKLLKWNSLPNINLRTIVNLRSTRMWAVTVEAAAQNYLAVVTLLTLHHNLPDQAQKVRIKQNQSKSWNSKAKFQRIRHCRLQNLLSQGKELFCSHRSKMMRRLPSSTKISRVILHYHRIMFHKHQIILNIKEVKRPCKIQIRKSSP